MSAAQPREELEPPLPRPTPTSRPFWDGLAAGEVRLQHCTACDGWVFYPRNRCSHCLADALEWQTVSGAARLYTWTYCRRPTAPHFAAMTPFVLAVVELDEGVRMTTTLVDADPEALEAGMPLEPVIETAREVPLLRYRPAS